MKLIPGRMAIIVVLLIALTFFGGLIYSVRLGDTLRYADEKEYLAIAENIATRQIYSTDGIHSTAFRPPAYPVLLALCTLLGANVLHLRMLNYAALCVCMLLLYLLLRKRSPVAGLAAVILVICYPVLFYTASTLFPQTIASMILLFIVYIVFRRDRARVTDQVLLGASFGVLILLHASFVCALVFYCGWILREQRMQGLRHAAIVVSACFLVLVPWLARNQVVFNGAVFVSTNSGHMLLYGNSEHTTPSAGITADISDYCNAAAGMDEVQSDRYYTREALRFMASHPFRTTRMYVLKFFNYFNYHNTLATTGESSRVRDLIMLLAYGGLLLILLMRILLLRRMPFLRLEQFCLCMYIFSGLFWALFVTRIRFRLPFDFLLIAMCAMAVSRTGEAWRFLTTRNAAHAADESIQEGRPKRTAAIPPAA